MNGTANINDIAIFTTSGIKGSNSSSIKALVALDNVDNTSDLNKPISTHDTNSIIIKTKYND